jgi:hypothetical protein
VDEGIEGTGEEGIATDVAGGEVSVAADLAVRFEGPGGEVVAGDGMVGATGRGEWALCDEALGSIANAVMNANTAMTSSQVWPVTLRKEASAPSPRISRRPATSRFALVMVAAKVRACSELPASWKRRVRWRTARMKAASSGHRFGAENWMWTRSGSALARTGNPVAVTRRTALDVAAKVIAPICRQARMDNLSHLSS